jgi:translation initiation factor IF-2
MLKKYKVCDLSKDLNVTNKEIVKLLKENFNASYSRVTALKPVELDVIFEHYTNKFELENFDSYFAPLKNQKLQDITQDNNKKVIKSDSKNSKNLKSKKNENNNNNNKIKKSEEKKLENKQVTKNKIKNTENKLENKVIEKKKVDAIVIKKQPLKRINTKTDSINIEKYNKKYEKIAFDNNFSRNFDEIRKQKFTKNQKSQKIKKVRKRESEQERLKRIENQRKSKPIKVLIPEQIVVRELALRLKVSAPELIKKLINLGTMVSITDSIDFDTASLAAMEFNAKVEKEVIRSIEELAIQETKDLPENLSPRAPVVVVMGHVDHGKTSILDYIRKTSVAAGESGGITQHIGAYKAQVGERTVTFLDTPGHEAFTSMRARGAKATDIAILVVAADDGIMPQTVEAINHAKDAEVSIIVAINKIDKPGADIEKVKRQLMEHNLVPEEWGGDVICVPVSAKNGTGISELLETLLLVADMKELKANSNREASGVVIESKVEKGRGVTATVLITNGTLNIGDLVVAGVSIGKVRSLSNELGKKVKFAGPSDPVEITGLDVAPQGGEKFNVIKNDKLAHELVEQRRYNRDKERFESVQKINSKNIFDVMKMRDMKDLKLIIKADVNGSAEALKQSLEKLSNDEILVKVIHSGVGAISESDVMFAKASGALIIGFNIKPNRGVQEIANAQKVEIKLYRIIYDCINEVSDLMKGLLVPETKEVHVGNAECRKIFKISSVGVVAGCYVLDGKIERGALVHVIRDSVIQADDKIISLKKYKDDVKEVMHGFECGILLEKFIDFKVGDIIETYSLENV